MSIGDLRQDFHRQIYEQVVQVSVGKRHGLQYPNFADGTNRTSCRIAWEIVERLQSVNTSQPLSGQTTGARFKSITASFIEEAFHLLRLTRPGSWSFSTKFAISRFDQHEYLEGLEKIESLAADRPLKSFPDEEYILKPDIVIGRQRITNEEIVREEEIVVNDYHIANLTSWRDENTSSPHALFHAGISCKWRIRSDGTKNSYVSALNLIRNRKGRLPHIAVVTAEPLPTRLAAIALGTGDVDCVYHFALHEMRAAIEEIDNEDQMDMLNIMIQGKRLRDISDLPFDLAM